MTEQKSLEGKLKKIDRRGWTLRPYKLWGSDKPCPPRLVVNVYKGCEFAHKYCYVKRCVKPQKGFRAHLQDRVKEAKKLGLEDVLVIVSSSTDPFQPIERKQKDSLFALETLLSNRFSVLVMTRNPQMLLEDEYARIIRNPKLYIDVSITSLHENDPNSIFYSATTPPLNETYASIKKLSEIGKYIRIKIEPIVPTTDEIKGQTKEELDEIVRLSKEAGAKKIISKTMRLNKDMPNFMQDKLMGYYLKNGVEEGYGDIMNHTLSYEIKRRLLTPVYEACAKYDIPFCACVDADVFAGKTVSCSFEEEK